MLYNMEEVKANYIKYLDTVKCKKNSFKFTASQNIKDDWGELENDCNRKVFVVRHGERVDHTFDEWIPYCFNTEEKYERIDLNMPVKLPKRKLGPKGYFNDTPITQIGIYQGILVGERIKSLNIKIDHAYSSPSFRCIQTCDAILQGLGKRNDLKIKVEPGLFELKLWNKQSLPNFLSTEELIAADYNIDTTYKPIISHDDLAVSPDTFEEYYKRTSEIVESTINTDLVENVLLVGHACTTEYLCQKLLKLPHKPIDEFLKSLSEIPYSATTTLANKENSWKILKAPYLSITHTSNSRIR